jgi:hypothetical protein
MYKTKQLRRKKKYNKFVFLAKSYKQKFFYTSAIHRKVKNLSKKIKLLSYYNYIKNKKLRLKVLRIKKYKAKKYKTKKLVRRLKIKKLKIKKLKIKKLKIKKLANLTGINIRRGLALKIKKKIITKFQTKRFKFIRRNRKFLRCSFLIFKKGAKRYIQRHKKSFVTQLKLLRKIRKLKARRIVVKKKEMFLKKSFNYKKYKFS